MYVPKHFVVTDRAALLSFIRAHPFGILISAAGGKPCATHVPFVILEAARSVRLGLHVAKVNPHWKSLDGADVLAIFHGPHAFVSASWYADPQNSVPTWDYSAVHCAGRAVLADDDVTQSILEMMVREFEGAQRWSMGRADPGYVQRMKSGIVGIEIAVTSIEGSFKFSQNRSHEDRERVLRELDVSCPELARNMREYYDAPVKL